MSTCNSCQHWQNETSKYPGVIAMCPVRGRFYAAMASCGDYTAKSDISTMPGSHNQHLDCTNIQPLKESNNESNTSGDTTDTELPKETDGSIHGTVTVEGEDERLRVCLQASTKGHELFAHQREDFHRFKDASEIGLFLEPGCGKSAITCRIAAWKYLRKDIDAMLIIAPNEVHTMWHREAIPEWLPPEIPREVQLLYGRGGAKKTHEFSSDDVLQIVCVNVDTFSTPSKWQEIAEWAVYKRTFIVHDEATSAKNLNTQRTQRILYAFNDVRRRGKTILSSVPKTVARAALTGTPVTNGLLDLWCIMEFLKPNYYNRNYYSFRNRYAMLANIATGAGSTQIPITAALWQGIKGCDSYEQANRVFGVTAETYLTVQAQDRYKGAHKNEEELKELTAANAVFRVLTDCVDMPPRNYYKRVVSMSSEQQNAYKSMEAELLAMYGGATTTAANKLSALVRLQQISSGFIVQGDLPIYDAENEDTWWGGINEPDILPGQVQWLGNSNPKLDALYRDIEECARPTIIVTRFSAEAARIYEDLAKTYNVLLYTGWKKTGTIAEFQENKYDIMVANIRGISRGLNLQNSHTMLFYTNTFSLEDRLQIEGRIYRTGQASRCSYTDYINSNTIDIIVHNALKTKEALLDFIRGKSLEIVLQGEGDE